MSGKASWLILIGDNSVSLVYLMFSLNEHRLGQKGELYVYEMLFPVIYQGLNNQNTQICSKKEESLGELLW